MAKYVIFRENSNTHAEVYLASMDKVGDTFVPNVVGHPHFAIEFDNAAQGYQYAAEYNPTLQWWRVGLR